MCTRRRLTIFVVLLLSIPFALNAQEFRVFNHKVQVHGFASQGFVYTDNNNWLTMDTHSGSFAMTDMGLNVSTHLTDKVFVGAQVYDRNLGELGQWHPSLDWAVLDFKFKPWLGFRGGKVKTTLGLYNDTQDLDFVHTFALLPQSVYPTDLRDTTIAHAGGDVYGKINLSRKAGSLQYTAYVGHRSDSIYSGYPYLLTRWNVNYKEYGGLQYGVDLRWNTPVKGLLVGVSRMNQDIEGNGTAFGHPVWEKSRQDWTNQFYGQYTRGNLQVSSEFRRYLRDELIQSGTKATVSDVKSWYVAGSYRFTKHFELGSYYSHYTVINTGTGDFDTSLPNNHIYDKVVSARFDVNRFWNVKLEGHFMDGYGNAYPNGFYPQQNASGFKPNTNALVVKTGFNF